MHNTLEELNGVFLYALATHNHSLQNITKQSFPFVFNTE